MTIHARFLRTLAVVAVATAASRASAQTADAAIDKATAAWAKVRTASGAIEQTVTNTLLRTSATLHADFQQERPNRLSVRYTDAKGDAIVSDGKNLWIYLPVTAPGQVIRRPAATTSGVPVDPGQFLENPRARFDWTDKGKETVGGRSTRVVSLTPKKEATEWFTRATVWIDETDGLVRQFEVDQGQGVLRRIRFTTLAINQPVDAKKFAFAPPKGVKIVDQK